MTTGAPRPTRDHWRDRDGTPHPPVLPGRADSRAPTCTAPSSRLHRRGEVIGGSLELIYVRFDGEIQVISVRSQ
jgi:hypothetical protein